MNKLELLNSQLLEARKSGNKETANILSTMKGEVENQAKNNPKAQLETLITDYALKSKKNLTQFKTPGWESELEILKPYLPKEITEQDVIEAISALKAAGTPEKAMLGILMKELKGVDVNLVKRLL